MLSATWVRICSWTHWTICGSVLGGDGGHVEGLVGDLAAFEIVEFRLQFELVAFEFAEGFLGVADDIDEDFLVLIGPD